MMNYDDTPTSPNLFGHNSYYCAHVFQPSGSSVTRPWVMRCEARWVSRCNVLVFFTLEPARATFVLVDSVDGAEMRPEIEN